MRYTKLPSDFWTSKAGRAIRACGPEGFHVYLYLRSCHMGNYVGIFKLNVGYAVLDLCIPEDVLIGYIEKFGEAGLVMYDSTNEIIWVIDQAEVQIGELKNNDKQIIAINKNVAAIERSAIRDMFFNRYHKQLKLSDALAPLQQVATQIQASEKLNDTMHLVDASPVSLNNATGEGCLEGVHAVLQLMRKADRETYLAADDLCVDENVHFIRKKFGARRAADIILNAIANNDLELNSAREFVIGCDI